MTAVDPSSNSQCGKHHVFCRLILVGFAFVFGMPLLNSPLVPLAAATDDVHARTGITIQPEVPVTAESRLRPLGNNSPVLAADPTDRNFLALASRVDGPDYSCALHVSADGGRSWAPVRQIPLLPKEAEKCYAPSVAFDAEGKMYFSFAGLAGTTNSPVGYFLTSSSDKANTFTPPRKVLEEHSYMVQMRIDMNKGKKGRMHLVWVKGSNPAASGFAPVDNPILARFSDDGGEHFTPPVRVSDRRRQRAVRPAMAFGPNGSVHVLYYDLKDDARDYLGVEGPVWDGTWALVVATSTEGGSRFSKGIVVNDAIVPPERIILIFNAPPPALATDKSGGVYAAWWDARNGDWDVFLSGSKNAGATWSEPVRVNDDPVKNGRHQYLPGLAVSPSGRVDVAFYDRRRDKHNVFNDVFYTYSKDGGRKFWANRRLNGVNFDSRIGFIYSPTVLPGSKGLFEFGSHPTLISNDLQTVLAWTDTSSGKFQNYRHQNIFSAGVAFSDNGLSPVRWLLVLLAMGLVGAGTIILWRRKNRTSSIPSERSS